MLFCELTINSTVHYLSQEGYAGTYYYDQKIFSVPGFKLDTTENGGYVRPTWGSINIAPDVFDGDWPPPTSCPITLKWGDTDTGAATIFTGTAILREVKDTRISFDLFEPEFDVDVLSAGTDENSNAVDIPIFYGTATHRTPQRTGTTSEYRYYLSGITSGLQAYDDGVAVSSTIDGSTFYLSATPVGEVSVSGVNSTNTLNEIFSAACTALSLTLDSTLSSNPTTSHEVSTQGPLLDYLDGLAGYFNHIFYISGSTLYLIDRTTNNGTRTLTEFDFFPATYKWSYPFRQLKAEWTTRAAGTQNTDTGTVYRLIDTEHEVTVASSNDVGEIIDIAPYNTADSTVSTNLTTLKTEREKPTCELPIPLEGTLPVPGEKISWTDTRQTVSTDAYIRVSSLAFDFGSKKKAPKVVCGGSGEVTAT